MNSLNNEHFSRTLKFLKKVLNNAEHTFDSFISDLSTIKLLWVTVLAGVILGSFLRFI